jgi:hypothetical protein
MLNISSIARVLRPHAMVKCAAGLRSTWESYGMGLQRRLSGETV